MIETAIIASAAISAASAIQTGRYAKAAADAEAAEYKRQEQLAQLEATEEVNALKRDALKVAASNKALFAAKTGADPKESASFLALKESIETDLDREIGSVRLMGLSNAQKYRSAAYQSRLSGKSALIKGYASAGSSLLSGYTKYERYKTDGVIT